MLPSSSFGSCASIIANTSVPSPPLAASAGFDFAEFALRLNGGGDSLDQILLFRFVLRADGEGIEHVERQRKFQGFVLSVAQLALAQDFHPHDRLARRAHFAGDTDNSVWIGIHVRSDGVDAH